MQKRQENREPHQHATIPKVKEGTHMYTFKVKKDLLRFLKLTCNGRLERNRSKIKLFYA